MDTVPMDTVRSACLAGIAYWPGEFRAAAAARRGRGLRSDGVELCGLLSWPALLVRSLGAVCWHTGATATVEDG